MVQARSFMRTAVPLMGQSSALTPTALRAFAQCILSAKGRVLVSITKGVCLLLAAASASDCVTCCSALEVASETITMSDWSLTACTLAKARPPWLLSRVLAAGAMSKPHTLKPWRSNSWAITPPMMPSPMMPMRGRVLVGVGCFLGDVKAMLLTWSMLWVGVCELWAPGSAQSALEQT